MTKAAHRNFRTLDGAEIAGRRVLLRLDLNVPMQDGRVSDDTRIRRSIATIAELRTRGARTIILAHLGRPDGKNKPELSLRPIAAALSQAMGGVAVQFASDCVGPVAAAAVDDLRVGEVLLLENVRFHAAEEENDPAFAQALAALGDLYVNDAFSCAHRAHASTEGLARLLPSYAGRLMQEELDHLAKALEEPQRPVIALVGGAKVSTKIALLENLTGKVDMLVIGGGMANTFLFAQGKSIGTSLAERDKTDLALKILANARTHDCEVILPCDAVIAPKLADNISTTIVDIDAVPDDQSILDIGPQSVTAIEAALRRSRTAVWNGPLGAFETKPFDKGTISVARTVARAAKDGRLVAVAGGGDTVAALEQAQVTEDFSYVSTAGGAFLEWLEGKSLPGVEALRQ